MAMEESDLKLFYAHQSAALSHPPFLHSTVTGVKLLHPVHPSNALSPLHGNTPYTSNMKSNVSTLHRALPIVQFSLFSFLPLICHIMHTQSTRSVIIEFRYVCTVTLTACKKVVPDGGHLQIHPGMGHQTQEFF